MRLDKYQPHVTLSQRSLLVQLLWYYPGGWLLQTRILPFSRLKALILRLFGARLGTGVVVKPGVRVKFPWKLSVGDYSWLGEDLWIDNLTDVVIGAHTCISQGVYICSGNHDWSKADFDLRLEPVQIGTGVWLCARSSVAPGAQIEDRVVLTLGSSAHGLLRANGVYQGVPASRQKERA